MTSQCPHLQILPLQGLEFQHPFGGDMNISQQQRIVADFILWLILHPPEPLAMPVFSWCVEIFESTTLSKYLPPGCPTSGLAGRVHPARDTGHLPAFHLVSPHSLTHAPSSSLESALSSLAALRRGLISHKYPLSSPSGASTKPILYSHFIISSLVFAIAQAV